MIWLSLISNPWVIRIVVVVVAVIGLYGYGHHKGWTARDAEMQAAIAEANEKARATEQKLTEQIGEQSNKLKEANDAVTEKQSALDRAIRAGRVRLPPAVVYQPPKVPPLPADIGTKREVNLTERLTNLLMPSEQPSPQSQKSSPKGTETPRN